MLRKGWIISFIFLILLLFLYRIVGAVDYIDSNVNKYNIKRHGVEIYKGVIDASEIKELRELCYQKQYKTAKSILMKNDSINEIIGNLGDSYVYQDYIWVIQKSSVHTLSLIHISEPTRPY